MFERDSCSADFQRAPWQHIAAKFQSGIAISYPTGSVGFIIVLIRPESAARTMLDPKRELMDDKICLQEIFNAQIASQVMSLIEEDLSEARNFVIRICVVRSFLRQRTSPPHPTTILTEAVARLRSSPALRISQLASDLDVSQRTLLRSFNAAFGIGPKRFSRVFRIEKALEARLRGDDWAGIAYDVGFTDQAHLIHDFKAIIGTSPEETFRSRCLTECFYIVE
jgi:AraC-like DNA-binding protein